MKKANLFIFLLLPFFCLAQSTLKLKGKIADETASLPWGNIVISTPEGKVVSGTTSNEEGTFEINVNKGLYRVKINSFGTTEWEKEILLEKDTDLGLILLNKKASKLDEVVIKTQKRTIEQKIDRLIYTIENNVSNIGGDALSAINTAPGVVVQNNAITILGKGSSRVMIDGRILELSGEELNGFLKSIAANDIKNIEIITNPPAKYDANGTGGLININLKKGTRDSWKNTTTLSYDQNKYGIYTLRNSFFYNKNKFRFNMSLNAKSGYRNSEENLELYFPDGLQQMNAQSKINEQNISGKLTLDYDISQRTTIGFQYLNDRNNPNFASNIIIKNYDTENNIKNIILNDGFNNRNSGNQTYNVHLLTKFDTLNKKLSVDFDYFNYDSKFDRDFTTKKYSQDMTFISLDQYGRNISNQEIANKSIKADMEHPLEFMNLSYGAKVSYTKSKSSLLAYDNMSGIPMPDLNQSNEFEYEENNQALYVNGNKKINDKFTIQLGLRAENTQTNGYSANLNQQIKNNYFKLFPTFYFTYKKDENNSFNLNYGKRINRPRFDLLNPFRTYINSNSYSEGNPFLKPSFSNNFELSHSYKEILRTSIFLNSITDGYGVIFTSDAATNTQVVTRENYYKGINYGIGESYTAEITDWWSTENTLYVLGSKTSFTSAINATPTNGLQLDFSTSNTFSLGAATKLQLDYTYSSPVKSGLYTIGYTSGLTIAIKQNLLKKNMQIAFLANDIFNTAYLKDFISVVNGIKQVYSQNESSRFFRVSLIYNFGNTKINAKQRDFGNEEEKRRIGN
ncbi:TonB-dependent receptor domain-containing protein [Flavobacterium poyangense]|uniref:TonB-dependent receptor domain-containing protein n=1 Tax=Flavobacterium poyangense TaxID=2204302 RepID=UPI001420C671|nr:TonB-dependent receptor [Flavobacterium sp. JXAS1]